MDNKAQAPGAPKSPGFWGRTTPSTFVMSYLIYLIYLIHLSMVQVQLQTILQPLVQAAVQPSVAPTVGSVPVPAPASAPAPASSGGECAFPAFVLSICLATGTPLAPSSAASQHPIASYMAFMHTPTACTNVLPPCVPFVPSLTSTSVLSHTPPGSSTAPAGCRSRSTRLSFDVGPGQPPIPPKLVEQIQQGEFIDLADLLPDSLRDNELPQELLLDNQHLLIPKQAQKREVHDIISWVDCWTAYSLVLLSGHPDQAVELLKYQDVIIRTCRSSPRFDVWLHYDCNFWRKASHSPVQLDWGATDLEVFHQAYTSSNALQAPPPSYTSAHLLHPQCSGGEGLGSPSGSEICHTWNKGRCTSGFTYCRWRHECEYCNGPHHMVQCSRALFRPEGAFSCRPLGPSPHSTTAPLGPMYTHLQVLVCLVCQSHKTLSAFPGRPPVPVCPLLQLS